MRPRTDEEEDDVQRLALLIGRLRGGDKELSYGDLLRPAMEVKTKTGARLFVKEYKAYLVSVWGKTEEDAENIVRVNVGYYAGYYDREVGNRVRKLYGFGHPIFG